MIQQADRIARYQRYVTLDPGNRIQQQGYDHLIDENGVELAPIAPGRDFLPADDM